MLHFTCDGCSKVLQSSEDRYVVKIEVFAAHDPHELTEADLEPDHLEAISDLLQENLEEQVLLEPSTRQIRYDLCATCRTRYLRDPLSPQVKLGGGKQADLKFDFSEN